MWTDPIVEEVREAGRKLAEECGYDLHKFFEMLRHNQKAENWPVVSADDVKRLKAKRPNEQPADKLAQQAEL